jgi:hypothetical protein
MYTLTTLYVTTLHVTTYSRLNENYVRGKKKPPHDLSSFFKEKEKGGEGKSKAWGPMKGSKLSG